MNKQPQITQVTHVSVMVDDQNKAQEFYTQKLGFEVRQDAPMQDNQRWVAVGPKNQPNMEVILQSPEWGNDNLTPQERRKLVGKMPGLTFESKDIEADYQRCKENGVEFIEEPQENPWGKMASFKDCCGNVHALWQLPA